jgi:transposase
MNPLINDELWKSIAPLIERPCYVGRKVGRPPADDRDALSGILYVLETGICWSQLPYRLGYGSGMTCLRRLREWQLNDSWSRIERVLQGRLPHAGRIDWERAWERRVTRRSPNRLQKTLAG